jgi:hypothetical protein
MTTLEDLRNAATRKIEEAFPEGVPPSADAMRNSHCCECEETTALFLGKRWARVAVSDLLHNPAPSLLTAAGFRYYLPAMMVRSMEAPRELDLFPDSVISLLSPPRGAMDDFYARRLEGFSRAQAEAIRAFLGVFERLQEDEWAGAGMTPEAFEDMPLTVQLKRAIDYWTVRIDG